MKDKRGVFDDNCVGRGDPDALWILSCINFYSYQNCGASGSLRPTNKFPRIHQKPLFISSNSRNYNYKLRTKKQLILYP